MYEFYFNNGIKIQSDGFSKVNIMLTPDVNDDYMISGLHLDVEDRLYRT